MSAVLTIGEFLIGIMPRLSSDTAFPSWPPDCFGLCLALLRRTGAYAQLLRDWPPATGTLAAWTADVRDVSQSWRKSSFQFGGLASEWLTVCESFELSLQQLSDRRPLCEALMKLVATADEASKGVGAPMGQAAGYDDLIDLGSSRLAQSGTLCIDIDPSRLRCSLECTQLKMA
jgi:hypothetical protein